MITKVAFNDYEGSFVKLFKFNDPNVNARKLHDYFEAWVFECGQSPIMPHLEEIKTNRFIRESAAFGNGTISLHDLSPFQTMKLLDVLQKDKIDIKVSIRDNFEDIEEDNSFNAIGSWEIIDSSIEYIHINFSKSFGEWIIEKQIGYEVKDELNIINLNMTE